MGITGQLVMSRFLKRRGKAQDGNIAGKTFCMEQ